MRALASLSFAVCYMAGGGSLFAEEQLSAISAKVLEQLPEGSAFSSAEQVLTNGSSATAMTPEGLVLIGGTSDGMATAEVSLLVEGEETRLPDFPHPVRDAGAAFMEGSVFVLSGNELYSLDLEDPSIGWVKHPSLPSLARSSPAMHAVDGELFVFGGETEGDVSSEVWGFRIRPLDGMTKTGWRRLGDMPYPITNAQTHQTGQSHLALLGGEPASDRIHIFHTLTDTWIDGGNLPIPIGKAAIAAQDGISYLLADGAVMELSLNREVKKLGSWDYGVILLYFGLMAGIGFYFARKQNSSDAFSLGGRNVKWWAAGVSMFATGASSISFMAIPASAFRSNLIWFGPALFIIPMAILQAYYVYPVIRRLNLTSTFEFLDRRFHPALRYLASGQMILWQVLCRMSVVMLLPALAITAVTGMPVLTSVLVMGILTTIYTALGGFEAVVWTDFTQGALMLFGGILMIVLAIVGLPGGFGEFVEVSRNFEKFDLFIWDFDLTLPVIWAFGIHLVIYNLAFAADQPVIQRVYATPLKDMRKLAGMYAFCSIAISLIACLLGIAIFAYFHAYPMQLDPGMKNDQIMPLYVVQRLPTGVAGLIIAAVFAASMSTLSSSMNSVATVTCEDFYRKLFPLHGDKARLRFMQVTSLLVGVFGTAMAANMATMNLTSMFEVWNVIGALIGGGFYGIYVLGMFTRRANSTGVFVGAIASVAITIFVREFTQIHWLFYNPVAMVSCIAIGYGTSIATGGNRKDLTGLTVFGVRKGLAE
ncbi:MAG: sodium/solute symporter [Verrucomicrobiota bacterium]